MLVIVWRAKGLKDATTLGYSGATQKRAQSTEKIACLLPCRVEQWGTPKEGKLARKYRNNRPFNLSGKKKTQGQKNLRARGIQFFDLNDFNWMFGACTAKYKMRNNKVQRKKQPHLRVVFRLCKLKETNKVKPLRKRPPPKQTPAHPQSSHQWKRRQKRW